MSENHRGVNGTGSEGVGCGREIMSHIMGKPAGAGLGWQLSALAPPRPPLRKFFAACQAKKLCVKDAGKHLHGGAGLTFRN